MATTQPLDGKMIVQAHEDALPTEHDMDVVAQKGWNGFTKFLLGNVVVTIISLLVIGLLTVWS